MGSKLVYSSETWKEKIEEKRAFKSKEPKKWSKAASLRYCRRKMLCYPGNQDSCSSGFMSLGEDAQKQLLLTSKASSFLRCLPRCCMT